MTCSVPGCERDLYARGWCEAHYTRWRTSGDVQDGKPLREFGRPLAERFWEKVDRSGGDDACWPWTGHRDAAGYGRFGVGGRKSDRAHRVAFTLSTGPIPDGHFVRHVVCDNPPCCNPSHLASGPHEANMRDKVRHGRQHRPAGEKNPSARLTAAEVSDMRAQLAAGANRNSLAELFGVTRRTVDAIAWREVWKEVT